MGRTLRSSSRASNSASSHGRGWRVSACSPDPSGLGPGCCSPLPPWHPGARLAACLEGLTQARAGPLRKGAVSVEIGFVQC